MEYTYNDVFDAKMEASRETEYYTYWEKDTRTLRALRGDIAELYHRAEYRMEEAKYKKDLAEKDAMIKQLRAKLAALESKKE